MKYSIVLAATAVSLSTLATAQTEREHDSHEHGSATLNVVIDKDEVFIELETPWNNLVGFEHEPGTDEQKALVDDAMAALLDPERLFSFDGGNCAVTNSRVESSMQHDDGHKDDDHHDDDGHKDDDHHDDDGHKDDGHKDDDHHDDDGHKDDDHDHDDAHDHDAEPVHSAALVSYSYSCTEVADLSAIDMKLFALWSGFEDLDVQLAGPGGQSSAELNPDQTTLKLDSVQ